jgi:hypothetical protein
MPGWRKRRQPLQRNVRKIDKEALFNSASF